MLTKFLVARHWLWLSRVNGQQLISNADDKCHMVNIAMRAQENCMWHFWEIDILHFLKEEVITDILSLFWSSKTNCVLIIEDISLMCVTQCVSKDKNAPSANLAKSRYDVVAFAWRFVFLLIITVTVLYSDTYYCVKRWWAIHNMLLQTYNKNRINIYFSNIPT